MSFTAGVSSVNIDIMFHSPHTVYFIRNFPIPALSFEILSEITYIFQAFLMILLFNPPVKCLNRWGNETKFKISPPPSDVLWKDTFYTKPGFAVARVIQQFQRKLALFLTVCCSLIHIVTYHLPIFTDGFLLFYSY